MAIKINTARARADMEPRVECKILIALPVVLLTNNVVVVAPCPPGTANAGGTDGMMNWLGQIAQSFGVNTLNMWQNYGQCLGSCLNQTLGQSTNNRNYFRDDTKEVCANQLK
jgi:hypothetical protein